MARYFNNILETIGNKPMVRINKPGQTVIEATSGMLAICLHKR